MFLKMYGLAIFLIALVIGGSQACSCLNELPADRYCKADYGKKNINLSFFSFNYLITNEHTTEPHFVYQYRYHRLGGRRALARVSVKK